jgi:hypothetical protein
VQAPVNLPCIAETSGVLFPQLDSTRRRLLSLGSMDPWLLRYQAANGSGTLSLSEWVVGAARPASAAGEASAGIIL